MATEKDITTDHEAFIQAIKSNLANVKAKVAKIRQTDTQLFVLDIVSPAAASLVAALAAIIGGNQMFSQAAAQSNDGGWVVACIRAAVLSLMLPSATCLKNNSMIA